MPTTELNIFTRKYLRDFNPEEPMFWRLKLPHARFEQLDSLIANSSHEQVMANPTAALCYLAEWYKWRYAPSRADRTRRFNPSGEEIKLLLASAGIDAGRWVAVNPETGRHSWLYSVYVLGGLPVAQELNRNADNAFLRRLCRMYHGENANTQLDDNDRAEAFRASLKSGGSLHSFIRDITSGNTPFAEEDMANSTSAASQLIRRIIDANNEVLRDKFRPEWMLSAPIGAAYFSRRLCLNLQPEITGEGLHQYLMYDRVGMWGFSEPAKRRWIEFGMRFLCNGKEVEMISPFLSYTNTFDANRGFLSVGVDRSVVVKDIPVADFDCIEIYALADNGECHVSQSFDVENSIQLYATDMPGEWSSAVMPRRNTAVLWRRPWQPTKPIAESLNDCRPFRSRKFGVSKQHYNLTIVPESLTLINQQGEEITFYNHQGTDTLTARRHDNLFRYQQGDKVRYIYEDEEGMEDEILLPLLMTRDDVIIRRVATDEFGSTTEEIIAPELIEFKTDARYEEWTEEVYPTSDRVTVRCSIRGRGLIREFAYTNGEIIRDLTNEEIHLPGSGWVAVHDQHFRHPTPFEPSVKVYIGKLHLDVWQPIDCKEINRGDSCYMRSRNDSISIPAIAAHELWVAIFNADGYRSYQCLPLLAVYAKETMVDKVGKLMNGTPMNATTLDVNAPPQLNVVFAYPKADDEEKASKWLQWDYMPQTKPIPAEYTEALQHNTVLMQDCGALASPLQRYCPRRNVFAFKLKGVLEKTSLLDCFKIASKYKAYFFLFTPLERITKQQFQTEIYQPLLAEYSGSIPSEINSELTRAAIELGFMTIDNEI